MQTSNIDSDWIIIENLIRKEGVARQHLNSYNEFLHRGIQEIINEVGHIDIETTGTPYKINFGKIFIGDPRSVELDGSISRTLPLESRLRDLNYSAPIYLEMTIEEGGLSRETQKHHVRDLSLIHI